MKINTRRAVLLPLAISLAGLLGTSAWAVNPGPATVTTSGQALNIEIYSPLDGDTVPAGPLVVNGRATIGDPDANTAVQYLVDVSGSTLNPQKMDCNGDGVGNTTADNFDKDSINGTVLDCEISGVLALNESLIGIGGVKVGLISFQATATQEDVDPAVAGTQAFTTPGASFSGVNNIQRATKLLGQGGMTNFDLVLQAMNASFQLRPISEKHVAYLVSDGVPNPPEAFTTGAGTPLAAAQAAKTTVFTYSVGLNGAGCGSTSPLRKIADATGGLCAVVTDPTQLRNALTQTNPAGISAVRVTVDGATSLATLNTVTGDFTANSSVAGSPGSSHTVLAEVTATDTTTNTASVIVKLPNTNADLSLAKTARQNTVLVGDRISYRLVVRNAGPGSATHVKLTDKLPSATQFVSASTTQGSCAFVAPTLSCSLGTLANGGSATINLVVKARTTGTIVNSASVVAKEPDPTPGNASSSVTVTANKRPSKISVDAVVGTQLSVLALRVNLKPRATLLDAVTNAPLVGKTVSFAANNALLIGTTPLCNAVTNSNGVATCSANILATTVPGVLAFGYTGAFAGDTTYLRTSGKGSLLSVRISVP